MTHRGSSRGVMGMNRLKPFVMSVVRTAPEVPSRPTFSRIDYPLREEPSYKSGDG